MYNKKSATCVYVILFLILLNALEALSSVGVHSGKYLLNEQQRQVNEVEKFWSQRDCSQGQVSVPCWGHVTAFYKLGSCVSASSYMRFIWHLCSESRLPYTSIPAFLMVWLQSIPFSPCTRSLLQHFLRHFLVAIDSLLPSEVSMEVFKHVTKQGDEPICENNWFVVKIRTMRRYLTDLSIIIC